MDVVSGDLSLSLDDGWVRLRIDGGDGHDIRWGAVGPICDPDCCPDGLEKHWESLRDIWEDSRGGGHEREAEWSWYDRLGVAKNN